MRPSVSGVPTWSEYSSGAAPVPPSLPSTTTKSGHAPHGGDLRRDLGRGQHAADPRLRALGELERHALDRRVGGLVGEPGRVEPTVGRAGAEVAAAQLPHQVAAVEVVAGQAALAGVVGEPARRRADVERAQGVGRQRAEAHRRDVQQRHVVGLRAVRAADPDPWRLRRQRDRRGGVHEVLVADLVDVALGAERLDPLDALRALVDDRSGVAVVGPAVEVALDEVLLQLRADVLEQEAEVPQHRVVAQDRVPLLRDVGHREAEQQHHDGQQHPPAGSSDRCSERGQCTEDEEQPEDEELQHSRGVPRQPDGMLKGRCACWAVRRFGRSRRR
jgi:hypothetical protein